MPARIHSNWITSYMKRVHETEPSGRYHLWVALMMIASSLGRKCEVRFGPETFFPNLYVILTGPPGARKGTAIKYGVKLLKEIRPITFAPDAVTRQQFFQELEKASTMEQMGKTVLVHSSLLVVAHELAVFMGDNDPQRLADLCDMYDGREIFEYKTKTSGQNYIPNPAVWILGATTPSWIEACMTELAVGGGITSRTIFVYAPGKSKSIPLTKLQSFDAKLEGELIHDLNIVSEMKGRFHVNSDADDTYSKWYLEVYPKITLEDKRLAYFMDRLPSLVAKLSIIVSAAQRDDMTITGQDILFAINLFNQIIPDMTHAFGGLGLNILGRQTEMVRALVKERVKLPKSMIMKTLRMHINDFDYQRIRMTLAGQRFIRTEFIDGEEWLILREEDA